MKQSEQWQADIDRIYIDESGFSFDMPRIRSYVGERCRGERDRRAEGRINAVGDVFRARVEQEPLPKPTDRIVIIMDNAAFRKRHDIQEIIISNGHLLEYLPVYSPDLNPIEHKRAQAGALGRKYRCSAEELFRNHKL